MNTFLKNFILCMMCVFCFVPSSAFAASIFTSSRSEVAVGDTLGVTIQAQTDGVLINSANISLRYDPELLTFSGYKSEGGAINVWLRSPSEKDGVVYMEGIIPGGVSGLYDPKKDGLDPIVLAHLLFTAKKSGNATFSFVKTEILKNDGKGSALSHENKGNIVSVINSEIPSPQTVDTGKPEPFNITFIDASLFGKTPPMIAFQAYDNESGIKEYKINQGGSAWVDIQSPAQVSKGFLSHTVTVRAFDFSGNFTDASVVVPGLISVEVLWIVVVLLALFCIILYRMIKYRR